MNNLTLLLKLLLLLLCFSTASYGKEACKKYLNKLHLVQAKQRQGHSFQRSNTLHQQESKARKKWWQCEKSPTKKPYKKGSKNNRNRVKLKNNDLASHNNLQKINAPVFKSSGAIIIKEKFTGKKKFAWLNYYQQPKKCKKPKSLTVFAYCVEDRQAQQVTFGQSYNK